MAYQSHIGEKWGKLTIIEKHKNPKRNGSLYNCICECGKYRNNVAYGNLIYGKTISCGCSRGKKQQYNKYDLSGEYGIGYTNKGEEFYFDLEDYNKIKDYCWRIDKKGYVVTTVKKQIITFHKLITNTLNDIEIDHIYHKTYDNRKSQLRVITHQGNMLNRRKSKNNKSGIPGVFFDNQKQTWKAYLTFNGQSMRKSFKTKEEAIAYRQQLEEQYFGEFAYKEAQ